ncbi:MAG: hypothetical protein ACSHXD_07780 [Marinosulfonomonas sp.]
MKTISDIGVDDRELLGGTNNKVRRREIALIQQCVEPKEPTRLLV